MRKILFIIMAIGIISGACFNASFGQSHKDVKDYKKLIKGRWVNVTDQKAEIQITSNKWIDYYNNKKKPLGTSNYFFFNNSDTLGVLQDSDDTLIYKIASVDNDNMQLVYFGAGISSIHGSITIVDFHKK